MSAMIPFGATGRDQFILAVDMREVAAHYGVRWRLLKHSGAASRTNDTLAHARDALFWLLIQRRKLTPQRAGDLLGATAKTAREAAARHQHRIAVFKSTFRSTATEASDAA